MVCLAAAIVSKTGRALVARQYHNMSRIRIEGLLSAFPKLLGSGAKQHTFVETESVRYVYQPIEGMFLVLVTNRQSNILEDLETLRLLAKIVPDYAPTLDEAGVARAAFELIFAFDEAISMGHKESITLSEVRENTEMASHEERLHKMILQSKMDEAKAAMRKKALEIEKTKIDRRRGAGPDAGMPGPMPAAAARMPDTSAAVAAMAAAASATAAGKASGMQLGAAKAVGKAPAVGVGRKAGVAILEQLRAEGEVVDAAPMQVAGHSAAQQQVLQQAAVSSDPVTVLVEERVSASLSKDGGVEATDLQGQMSLTINTDEATFVSLGLSGPQDGFQFKTHPNVDKQAYALGTLQLKDPSRPFPTGTPLVVLKWRLPSLPESKLPLLITCWPNPGADSTSMTLEYEASEAMDLSNVAIAIPLPALSKPPAVGDCEGQSRWVSKDNLLLWEVPLIDAGNRSGSLEFSVPGQVDTDVFFPISVAFVSKTTLCPLTLAGVTNLKDGSPVKYGMHKQLSSDKYVIG